MATAVDRRGRARRRRPRPGAWFVIAPLAVGLVVVAAVQPRAKAGADLAQWQGRTAQGLAVTATINGRWLDGVSVPLRLRCDRGAAPETFVWTPPPERYAQRGSQVAASQVAGRLAATDGWRRAFDGQLRMVVGAHPRGTAAVTLTWTRGDSRVVCRSGPVAFSLRQGAT